MKIVSYLENPAQDEFYRFVYKITCFRICDDYNTSWFSNNEIQYIALYGNRTNYNIEYIGFESFLFNSKTADINEFLVEMEVEDLWQDPPKSDQNAYKWWL